MVDLMKPSFEFEDEIDGEAILRKLERAARTCYKSEGCIKSGSAAPFIRKLINDYKHESVIEHTNITVRVICDRGVTHEIVRHRLGAYSQESTRYCDYGKAGSIKVIVPYEFEGNVEQYAVWLETMAACERGYNQLRALGASPQWVRSVLPNSLKTEIVVTYNLRQWRHFFKMRAVKSAHPQMREVAVPLLAEFKRCIPVVFDDLFPETPAEVVAEKKEQEKDEKK
ncbi:MAG: FAD-dependent thymidylate synthase [Candidatus Niyogibacteria bacterium]|nr:FAD-dependent thymidylate synthase [Candidatus Niyogibacteria bacterium]